MRMVMGLIALIGSPIAAKQAFAQEHRAAAVEDSEAALARLLRTGAIRRVGKQEDQRLRAAVRVRGRGATTMPFYVVRKPFAGLNALNGGNAVNFLVPWAITLADYGQTHSSYYRPSGLCLHGASCPPCPPETPASPIGGALDATAAGCIALPSIQYTR